MNCSHSLFFASYSILLSILLVLPAAKLHYTLSFSVSVSLHLSACLFLLGAQPGKWTATDEAPCLSAVLEGINHNSVSALMRIQRFLLEIEPSGVSDSSCTDSSLGRDTESGIKASSGPSSAPGASGHECKGPNNPPNVGLNKVCWVVLTVVLLNLMEPGF